MSEECEKPEELEEPVLQKPKPRIIRVPGDGESGTRRKGIDHAAARLLHGTRSVTVRFLEPEPLIYSANQPFF